MKVSSVQSVSILLVLILMGSTELFASPQEAPLPLEILNNPAVLREMQKATQESAELMRDYGNETDAENQLELIVEEPNCEQKKYVFNYFSAEHYKCELVVLFDFVENRASIVRPFFCSIEE